MRTVLNGASVRLISFRKTRPDSSDTRPRIVSRAADSFVFGSGRPNDRFDDSHYLAAATLAGSILFLLSFFGLGIAFLIAGEDARWRSLWQQPLAAGICLWFWFMLDWFVLNTQVRRASRRAEGRGRK